MTWPDVLRWLALIAGTAASIAGLAWTLGRIFRPWMREAAQAAADDVRAEVKALSDKLATNDFPHMETRIERGLAESRSDLEAMESRLGGRIERSEARIGERFERMGERIEGVEARIGERFDRMGGRIERMEARILAALQRRPDTDDLEA